MTCTTGSCGLGGWGGALPGDPSNDITLSAVGVYGGIQVSWAYPSTNPFAVSYIKVYRGLSAVFSSAMKIAEVSGDRYFDKVLSGTRYYYWIQVTSINGTVAGTIGPASAIAQAAIDEIYTLLSGMIDSSLLTTSLRTNIDKIGVLGTSLQAEVDARLADNTSLGTVLAASELEMAAIRSQLISDRATNAANNSTLATAVVVADLARANGDIAEVNARVASVFTESRQRLAAEQATAEALLQSILTTESVALNASTAVALARQELGTNITTGLRAESSARTLLATRLDTANAVTTALVNTEATARSTAVAAEASLRDLLAAQFRGAYPGADINSVTEGLFYQERLARATQDTALAQQITLLSAGSGEQFDWKSIWYFDSGTESWTGNGAPTQAAGFLRPANQASNAYVESPSGLAIDGAVYTQIRLRVRKTGTVTWGAYLYWKSPSDTTWDVSRRMALTVPTWDVNGIGLVIATAVGPGVNWGTSIGQIRIDLSSAQDAVNYMELDWVAVGRPSPGASSAQLLAEQTARVSADGALTTSFTTLSSQVNNLTTGLPAAHALIASNYTTLANADTAEAALRVLLTARVDTAESGLSAAQSDILTEAVTRASDDSTNASNITALSSQVNNVTTGLPTTRSDMLSAQTTQAGINSALASDTRTLKVQTAGVDADILRALLSGEATRVALDISVALARQELQTQMTAGILAEASARLTLAAVVGTNAAILTNEQLVRATNDSARASSISVLGTTVADNTAALVAESTARSTADYAMATDISNLSATVTNPTTGLLATRATLLSAYYTAATVDSALASNSRYLRAYADLNSKTFRQGSAPTSRGLDPQTAATLPLKSGDFWINTSDSNRPYQYTGSAWVLSSDTLAFDTFVAGTYASTISGLNGSIAGLSDSRIESWFQTTDPSGSWTGTGASHTGDLWYSTATLLLKSWSGTAWTTIQNKVAIDAAAAASAAQTTANGKIITFAQGTTPTASSVGDLWIDTSAGNKLSRWSGSAWVALRDSTIVDVDARVTNIENAKIGYCSIGGEASDQTNRTTCEAAGGLWNVGLPMAQAVKQVTVSDGTGSATIESRFTSQKTLNNGLQAQQTIKLDVNGFVSGYGIYGDAAGTSEFIANVGKFAVTSPDGLVPLWAAGEAVPLNAIRRLSGVTGKVLVCKKAGTTAGPAPSLAGVIGSKLTDGGVLWQVGSRVPFAVLTAPTTISGTSVAAGVYIDAAYLLNATVNDAHISDLTVDKLTTGALTIGTTISSSNWGSSGGAAGWQIDANGNATFNNGTFRGDITGATGTFAGSVSVNGATYLTGPGFWTGMDAGVAKLRVGSTTQYLRWTGSALEIVFDSMTSTISPSSINTFPTAATPTTYSATASVSGGVGPYKYYWSVSSDGTDRSGVLYNFLVTGTSGTYGQTVNFSSAHPVNSAVYAYLQCTVIDANGRSTIANINFSSVYGTLP